jgi:hypothetical protein
MDKVEKADKWRKAEGELGVLNPSFGCTCR